MDQVVKARDLLIIIGNLVNNGADPTMKSHNMGLTPRQITITHRFKRGSALLRKLMILSFSNFPYFVK